MNVFSRGKPQGQLSANNGHFDVVIKAGLVIITASILLTLGMNVSSSVTSQIMITEKSVSEHIRASSLPVACPWQNQSRIHRPLLNDTKIALWGLPQTALPPVSLSKHSNQTGFQFLPNYRNPCWIPLGRNTPVCLPYFYQLGVAKSGTSQLYTELLKHPLIESPDKKEPWFWNMLEKRGRFEAYLRRFNNAVKRIHHAKTKSGCHEKIMFEATSGYFTRHGLLDIIPNNTVNGEPKYTLAHTLYAMNPATKLIVSMRHPTDRLFSHYHHFHHGEDFSAKDFHEHVVIGIDAMTRCISKRTLRSCAFDDRLKLLIRQGQRVMLQSSMYYPYAKEWLNVFPRDQIMFIKAEDFYSDETAVLKQAFKFLEIGDAPLETYTELEDTIAKSHSSDSKTKRKSYRTQMLNETRTLLDKFFKPFNQKLAQLLGDEKWLFGS